MSVESHRVGIDEDCLGGRASGGQLVVRIVHRLLDSGLALIDKPLDSLLSLVPGSDQMVPSTAPTW